MSQIQYRPEIDGLRAVAVLSVLLHHLAPKLLPGGFVGVDIFFVISGYLITQQIGTEAGAGTFSLRQFYKRRISRIAPALFTVMAATLVAGWFLLSPPDLVSLGRSAAFASVGLSNIYFAKAYAGYFAGNSGEVPLLHTWSLGVEEQYYLLWPLFLLLFLRWVKGPRRLPLLALGLVGTLAVSQAGRMLVASYYLLPTRAFELMIGGVLAIAALNRSIVSPRYATASSVAGHALIGASFFLLDQNSPFPGLNALWPCLGAALLISAGRASPLAVVLTNRPFVFVGLISYSLYLWHWPIIAYLHYVGIPIHVPVGLAVTGASFLLSWLTWRFVETPMRKTGAERNFAPVFGRRFALPALAFGLIAVAVGQTAGFPGRFPPLVAEYERELGAEAHVLRGRCHVSIDDYGVPPSDHCRLGADKPTFDGMLIGDSYANHFSGMVDVMARREGLTFMDYTMNGCPPILGYSVNKMPAYARQCQQRNETAVRTITERHFSRVILAGQWPRDPEAGARLLETVSVIAKTGARLTIIVNNELIRRASKCPVQKAMYGTAGSCDVDRKGPPDYIALVRQRYPAVHFIDPNEIICSGTRCSPVVNGVLLYRDNGHLNDVGSRLLGRLLLERDISL